MRGQAFFWVMNYQRGFLPRHRAVGNYRILKVKLWVYLKMAVNRRCFSCSEPNN
jgi:hypothetical protein